MISDFRIFMVCTNDNIDKQTIGYFNRYLDDNKKQCLFNKRQSNDKNNCIISDVLSKVAIKKTFSIDIAKQKIAYTEYGKPYLLNYPDVHFNISHSGKYVTCAVSYTPVGIDIQKISEYNSDVAKRVCNEKELKQIEDSLDKASEFTKLWTQKEAVLKMHGTGIASGDIKNCLDNHNVQSKRIEDYWVSVCV